MGGLTRWNDISGLCNILLIYRLIWLPHMSQAPLRLGLINPYKMSSWGSTTCGPTGQHLGKKWRNLSHPCQKQSMWGTHSWIFRWLVMLWHTSRGFVPLCRRSQRWPRRRRYHYSCGGSSPDLGTNWFPCGRQFGSVDGDGREGRCVEGQGKRGQKSQKASWNGLGKYWQQNFKRKKKPRWEQKDFGSAIQGKGIAQTIGEPSFGSAAMVTTGTNIEGKENKKGGPWVRPCMACGGKHKFQECPEWKQI